MRSGKLAEGLSGTRLVVHASARRHPDGALRAHAVALTVHLRAELAAAIADDAVDARDRGRTYRSARGSGSPGRR